MLLVAIRREEHVVVCRATARAPRQSLKIGEERMRRRDLPVIPERILLPLDAEYVGQGAELIVREADAEAIAKIGLVTPVPDKIDPASAKVRAAGSRRGQKWTRRCDPSADDRGRLIDRSHLEIDAAAVARKCLHRRVGEKGLRPQDALRLCAS